MNNFSGRRDFLTFLISAAMIGTFPITETEAEADDRIDDLSGMLSSLGGLDDKKVATLANGISKWRNNILLSLTEQLKLISSTKDMKIYAIYFLGALKLEGAIDVLINNIHRTFACGCFRVIFNFRTFSA